MPLKLRRFSEERYNIESNQISFWDKELDEGLYNGEYYDFEFIFKVNGKEYRMRFDASSYGDDEFDAVVYYSDGIATLFSVKDFENLEIANSFKDRKFLN